MSSDNVDGNGEAASEPKKVILTDPARELVELCELVHPRQGENILGEVHLATMFEVGVWSKEFYQIIFTISERVDLLAKLIGNLELDEDFRDDIVSHVKDILVGFSGPALRNHWEADGQARVGPKNVQPLKAISGHVRSKIAYKKLTAEEIAETLAEVSQLITWLENHQLSEQDFIRQALIDGLTQFNFRLEKVQWLGWGYALDSLREVIAAYVMLERMDIDPNASPDVGAVMKHVAGLLKSVYERVETVKGMFETGDFLLKVYGAGALWYQAKPAVVALLGSG